MLFFQNINFLTRESHNGWFSLTLHKFLVFNCIISPKTNFVEINFAHAFPNLLAVAEGNFLMSNTIGFLIADGFYFGIQ